MAYLSFLEEPRYYGAHRVSLDGMKAQVIEDFFETDKSTELEA